MKVLQLSKTLLARIPLLLMIGMLGARPSTSLRCCGLTVCGHGYTISESFIYNAPSYSLRDCSGNPGKNFRWMKKQCLQDEGVDGSSHCMGAFVWDFEGSPKGFHMFPPKKFPSWEHGNPQIPHKCSHATS